MKNKKSLLLILSCILLISCGGGGGGGGGTPNSMGGNNLPIRNGNDNFNIPSIENNNGGKVDSSKNLSLREILEKRKRSSEEIPTDERELDGSTMRVAVLDDGAEHAANVIASIKEKDRKIDVFSHKLLPSDEEEGEEEDDEDEEYVPFTPEQMKEMFEEDVKAHEYLMQNMKNERIIIFNHSYGIDQKIGKEELKKNEVSVRKYKNIVNTEKTLFVWANGNGQKKDREEKNFPDMPAGLPIYYPELEKAWISAVGVEKERNEKLGIHYKDFHLAYPGDKAKWWSISADAQSALEPDNPNEIGSSYAAPRVTAAAAMVAEKFPWMTVDQIRQTLFTTAMKPELKATPKMRKLYKKIDEGKITAEEAREFAILTRNKNLVPDNKYGWGILSSLYQLGPGAFTNIHSDRTKSPDFIANIPKGTKSYFENDIHGNGGLIKRGEGELVLTGNNTYKGKSVVEVGKLDIYGVHSSGIKVEKSGTLALHDKAIVGYNNGNEPFIMEKDINASKIAKQDVDNSGIMEVYGTSSIIGGDYNAKQNSKTIMDINNKLNVVGNINLENNSKLILKSKEYVSGKTQKTIAQAKKINNPENMTLSTEGMISAKTISTDDGIAIIEVDRKNATSHLTAFRSVSSVNTANNIEKTLKNIDDKVVNGTVSKAELRMAKAMQAMPKKAFTEATEKMSGEIYASAQALTFSQAQDNNRVLSNHLANIDKLDKAKGKNQVWATAMGSNGKIEKSGYATGKTKVTGGQLGIDKQISDKETVGLGLSYSYATANFNRFAGKAKSDMIGLSVYGKKEFNGNIYALGRLGISHIKSNVKRELINIDGQSVQGKIYHKDYLTSFYAETGKKYEFVMPYIGLSYDYLRRGSFSESNAAWGINSKAKDYFSANLVLGLRAEYKAETYSLQSYVKHSLNIGNRNLSYEGNFTGNSTKQSFKGIDLAKNSTWLGLGVFKNINDNLGIYLNVDGRLEDKKSKNIIYSTGIQYKF